MKVAVVVLLLFVSAHSYCQEASTIKDRYSNVLKKIRTKINRMVRPAKVKPQAAIMGIRGNKYDSKRNIYWKTELSDKMKEKIRKDAQEIEKVIDDLIVGKDISLAEYIKNNPDNYFLNEIKEIYNSLNESKR